MGKLNDKWIRDLVLGMWNIKKAHNCPCLLHLFTLHLPLPLFLRSPLVSTGPSLQQPPFKIVFFSLIFVAKENMFGNLIIQTIF